MSTKPGPTFGKRKPRLNHVAMSLSPDVLDEEHRKLLVDFYADVFGFVELPMLTEDRRRLVLQVHDIEQFLFLIADDEPMTCPRLDHWGVSVGEESELDEILARAKRGRRATIASTSSTRRSTTTACSRSRASTCATCCR